MFESMGATGAEKVIIKPDKEIWLGHLGGPHALKREQISRWILRHDLILFVTYITLQTEEQTAFIAKQYMHLAVKKNSPV